MLNIPFIPLSNTVYQSMKSAAKEAPTLYQSMKSAAKKAPTLYQSMKNEAEAASKMFKGYYTGKYPRTDFYDMPFDSTHFSYGQEGVLTPAAKNEIQQKAEELTKKRRVNDFYWIRPQLPQSRATSEAKTAPLALTQEAKNEIQQTMNALGPTAGWKKRYKIQLPETPWSLPKPDKSWEKMSTQERREFVKLCDEKLAKLTPQQRKEREVFREEDARRGNALLNMRRKLIEQDLPPKNIEVTSVPEEAESRIWDLQNEKYDDVLTLANAVQDIKRTDYYHDYPMASRPREAFNATEALKYLEEQGIGYKYMPVAGDPKLKDMLKDEKGHNWKFQTK